MSSASKIIISDPIIISIRVIVCGISAKAHSLVEILAFGYS
jgi:hypothetical protein